MEKPYDLENRTEEFTKAVIYMCKRLPKSVINNELMSQVVRSAGSVGANYIETNESLSKKDFAHRIRICRKEAKESRYWLSIISSSNPGFENEASKHIKESIELMNIFGAILKKSI
jgi:four helix bundle protein